MNINPEEDKKEQEKPLTPYQERQMKDLALDKDLFKGNSIDLRVLDRLHKNKKLKDNAAKYAGTPSDLSDPYYHYINALRKGHFTKGGLRSVRLLEALSKGDHEKKKAQEILEKIFKSNSALSEKAEDSFIAELDRARAEDFIQNPDAMMANTKTAAEEITTEADRLDIKSRISIVTEDTDERTMFELGPYQVKCPDRMLVQKLNAFAEEFKTLSEVYKEIFEEWDGLTDKLVKGVSDVERKKIEDKLEAIGKVKFNIEKRMFELKKESEPYRKEYLTWAKKHLERFRSLSRFQRMSGVDLRSGKDLQKWKLDIEYHTGENSDSSSLGGIEADKKTGKAKRMEGVIHIEEVYFEDEEDEEDPSRNTANTEFPGRLMVRYREDDNPEVMKEPYINFVHLLDGVGAHEDIKTVAEMEDALGMKPPLKKGDVFRTRRLVTSEDGKTQNYQVFEFTIEDVITEKGKQLIVLDKHVKTLDKKRLSDAVHPALYFDRYAKNFTPGEFAKLIRQDGYKRKGEGEEDMWNKDVKVSVEDGITLEEEAARREAEGYPDEPYDDDYVIERMPRAYGLAAVDVTNKHGAGTAPAAGPAGAPPAPGTVPTAPVAPAGATPAPGSTPPGPPTAPTSTLPPIPESPDDMPSVPTASTQVQHDEDEEDLPPIPEEPPHSGEPKTREFKSEEAHEEALPFEKVHKVGNMHMGEDNFLSRLWRETRVLSVDDFWKWGKSMYEYYERRWERYQKEKYSVVGKNLPYFAPEMERIHQAAENEEVHHFKESFDLKGIFFIEERLAKTNNKDELKACIEVLIDKGEWRLDNLHFWENLNTMVDPKYYVPIPRNGDPYTLVDEKTGKTGFDYLEPAIDSLWGEGTYAEFFAKNKGNFESGAKKFYEKGNEMEGDERGHTGRLKTLLSMHKQGLYVSPHEFEGMIRHAIDYGKSDMQTKLYYMVAGVTAKNPHGHTILSFDRIAHINSALLPKFPLLDFMTRRAPRPGGGSHRFTKDDYEVWMKIFDGGDPTNCEPNQNVDDFLWKYVSVDDKMITRINKAIRNGENLDHDDMFMYLPPVSEGVIDNACRAISGSKKALTQEGYANGFPGFSQYMKSLSENGHKNRLKESIKSYVRFMGIMTNRYDKGNSGLARLDDNMLRDSTVVSDYPPNFFIKECNQAIRKVIAAYSDHPQYAELSDKVDKIFDWQTKDIRSDKAEADKQKAIDYAFDTFGKIFNEVIKSDNGEKMMTIVKGENLYGMPDYIPAAEKEKRKQEKSSRYDDDQRLD